MANSLTAANVVGLSPWRGAVNIAYLRETLSVDSVPSGPKRALMLYRTFAAFDGFIANSAATRASIPAPLARIPVKVAYPVSGIGTVVDGAPLGSTHRFRVLTLSRLEHWKGVHVVVDAYEELQRRGVQDDFELRIAGDATLGDPAYLARIATQVARLGPSAILLGRLDDVQSALDDVDAVVIPTLRPEPFGQVMAQGIARGRLIISSGGGGPTEILGPTAAAVFVQAGDIEALADALQFAHADLAASGAIAHRGQARAELFLDHRTTAALSDAILALGSGVQR
ncbi:glycosyltransferase family 4 protein [Rathayibacter iranicus]|uniref:glycosyltransferase family 4 protein n=1 Tax=Rathayibacter iranicus TaxID=59737 RepID=UPI0010581555|nr:glycosyltransferase family 4 protein [Rathayibacter iranicus]